MQVVFILGAAVGLVFVYFGIRKVIVFYRAKSLITVQLVDGSAEFEVSEPKRYTVFITGGFYVSDAKHYHLKVRARFGGELSLSDSMFKQRLMYKGQRIVEHLNFTAEPGNYILEQQGAATLKVKMHRHPFLRPFTTAKPQGQLGIVIRERVSPLQFGLSIAMTVIGVQMAAWGVILALNPQIFE